MIIIRNKGFESLLLKFRITIRKQYLPILKYGLYDGNN